MVVGLRIASSAQGLFACAHAASPAHGSDELWDLRRSPLESSNLSRERK
jgi:hypothetical protein